MISVCIATYNGEKYIGEQIDSILRQIGSGDEVIVCDDGSNDETLRVLSNYNDGRIRIYRNKNRLGHVRNFEKALSLACGDYIFLSDQDDIWIHGRVKKMLNLAQANPKTLLIASNFDVVDEYDVAIGEFRKLGQVHRFRVIQTLAILAGRAPYYGCTFLLKKGILNYCLPIPDSVESHDVWIALIASFLGGVMNIRESTLRHRIHDKNVTAKRRRSLVRILISRWNFLSSLVIRIFKLKLKSTH